MNWPYLHLLTNHAPIIVGVLGAAAALAAHVLRRRAAWLYAFVTITLAGLSAYPTVFVGEEAGDWVERQPGVSREAVHDHEEASELAMWVLLAAGALAAFGWWRLTRDGGDALPPAWLRALVVLAALGGAGTVAYAAFLGGHILHGANTLGSPPSIVAPGLTAAPGAAPAAEPDEGGRGGRGRH
jgi:hypothetical protein